MNNPASWLTQFDMESRLRDAYRWAADGQRLSKIQSVLAVLLALWALNSLSSAAWALWPNGPITVSQGEAVNPPPTQGATKIGEQTIDVSSILGLSVFGTPNDAQVTELPVVTSAVASRDGVENGAQETSLALKLTGIVASTADGLGTVMIEARKQQELYAVGDDLPVNGKVTLAKILTKQVVIDNNGTYELLTLFDDNGIVGIVQSQSRATSSDTKTQGKDLDAPAMRHERGRLAANYRDQLYNDPQSLAGLVSISAVQADGRLKGYKVSPGRDAAQFKSLGFEPGDIVTAVNGYALSDPSNTLRLYQLMQDATNATFDIDRRGSPVSINVSLSNIQ
jgi:general secretion pathway protein C